MKPEDVISPYMAIMLALSVLTFTAFLVYGTVHWFSSIGVMYDPVYAVVFGWMWALPTMLIVAYLRAILLTRDKDLSGFAKMYTLDIIALSPIISGVLKYFNDPGAHGLYIPIVRDIVCFVVILAVILEMYLTIWTNRRNNKNE